MKVSAAFREITRDNTGSEYLEWHERSITGALASADGCREFCEDLATLHPQLIAYTHMLSDMARVEGLTILEEPGKAPLPRTIT